MDWINLEGKDPTKIYEVSDATDEPIDIYRERYKADPPQFFEPKLNRYYTNAIIEMEDNSSLLVFGSGHPKVMNHLPNACPNIGKMGCVDFMVEAGDGLDNHISYYNIDILKEDLPTGYDYIFTSHTLEHFTRDQLLNIVMPRLQKAAGKAVVAVVPYGEAWGDEPSHKCRFWINDELSAMASKYKIILQGHELVLWIG